MIKVAVIGCGTIATSQHIPAYKLNPNAEIIYFCDIKLERAEKAAKEYGSGKAVSDYREILSDPDLDAVSVCTPNKDHKTISIDFLRAGKHVLCEKPVARTLTEALEMQKVQNETGLTLNIGVVNRFNVAVNEIKNKIDKGELGNIYHVYISFRAHRSIPGLGGAFTTNEIAGGGVLIDWGVHFLDLVMYCCGDPAPQTISGETFSILGKDIPNYVYEDMWAGPPTIGGIYDVEEFVTAFVRTSGPTFSINGAWAQNIGEGEMFVDFLGDKAGVRLQYGGDFTLYTTKDGKLVQETPALTDHNAYQEEIDQFLKCIKTGEKLPSHIDTAIITARIMQAIYDSATSRKEITL